MSATVTTNVGPTLRTIRKARGLSLAQLGEIVGVTPSAIGQWERGVIRIDGRHLRPLSDALGIPVDLLVDGTAELASLSPDAIEIAVRADKVDARTRAAVLALLDVWIAGEQ